MGFSLNTSPAEESDGGSVGDDSIEESFWQTNLWPIANHNHHHHQSPPPPSTSGGRINAPAFVFPLLDGGVGAEQKVVEPPAGMGKGKDEEEEEEIKSTTLTINCRKRRSDEDRIAADHVNGERERRKKMRSMFTTLQSFLPHLSHKVDKATIVDEAINLIKTLQTTIQDLQHKAHGGHPNKTACAAFEPLFSTGPQLRLAGQTTRESFLADYGLGPSSKPNGPSYVGPGRRVMFQTWTSSNVVLNTFGKNEALIMACSRKKPGVLTAIVAVLVKHKVEVEGLHTFCNGDQCSYMIHARLANGDSEQRPKFKAEEVYKEAVSEMILLVVDNVVKGKA